MNTYRTDKSFITSFLHLDVAVAPTAPSAPPFVVCFLQFLLLVTVSTVILTICYIVPVILTCSEQLHNMAVLWSALLTLGALLSLSFAGIRVIYSLRGQRCCQLSMNPPYSTT